MHQETAKFCVAIGSMLKLDVYIDHMVHSCVLFQTIKTHSKIHKNLRTDTLIPEFRHHADWLVIHETGMH